MVGQPIGDMDAEYATTIADRAMRLMTQQSVPPTPNNFSVWFEYSLGNSPALRKIIDILIQGKRKFDAATNAELYITYIAPQQTGRDPLSDLPDQLGGLIDSAQQFLNTAVSDNQTHIKALGEVSSEAASAADPRPLIAKLVDELSKATAAGLGAGGQFRRHLRGTGQHPQLAEGRRAALQYRCAHRPRQPPLDG